MGHKLAQATGLLTLAALTACGASKQFFVPAERAVAQSPSGYPAAEYVLGADGIPWGEVRVWSTGAEVRRNALGSNTVISIGFEIENTTDETLELDIDLTRVESIEDGQETIPARGPDPVTIDTTADKHSVQLVDLEFSMPEGIDPDDMDAFRVRWLLRGPDRTTYEQHTSFLRIKRYYYPRYYGGYDPWYGRWGWPYCW